MPDPDFDPEEFRHERVWWFKWTWHFNWPWDWRKKMKGKKIKEKKDKKGHGYGYFPWWFLPLTVILYPFFWIKDQLKRKEKKDERNV